MWQRYTPTYWKINIMTDTTYNTPLYQILSYLVNFITRFHKDSFITVANISEDSAGSCL